MLGMRIVVAVVYSVLLFAIPALSSTSSYDALKDLYYATNGPIWGWTGVPWNFSAAKTVSQICQQNWQGITCALNEIAGLELSGNGMSGQLPTSIDGLTSLEVLSLENNYLSGSIPASMGNLMKLSTLSLTSTLISGPIPPSLGNIPHLQRMILDKNRLTGSVPANLGSAAALEVLALSSNSLSGPIPASIGSVRNMQYFDLSVNMMSGTIASCFCDFQSLFIFNLGQNYFNDSIPQCIGHLAALQQLLVYNNLLTGSLPISLGDLRNMTILRAQENYIDGTLPTSLGNLTNLLRLDFGSNLLTGQLPSSLGKLRQLEELIISFSSLTGHIPPSIGDLENMVHLDFNNNILTGEIPSTLNHMPQLEYLDFSENVMVGTIPAYFCSYHGFWYFNLYQNYFNGSIPECIGNLTALEQLYLFNNLFTGSLPPSIGDLGNMAVFLVQENFLGGSIPDTVNKLVALEYVFMFENQLTGTLPNFTLSVDLTVINLDTNALTGTVPVELQRKTMLQQVILCDNLLTGRIPDSFAFATYLFLDDNAFTGTLPGSWFDDTSKLVQLSVADNFLSGAFPSSWPSLLQDASFAGNRFNGTLTEALFERATSVSYLDFSHNLLEGTLHPYFFNGTVRYLFLSGNQWTGTIPTMDVSATASVLEYVSFSTNYIEGTLPSSIAQLWALTAWIGADNFVTGTLDGVFAAQSSLNEIVMTNNLLTGSLENIFQSSSSSGIVINLAYNALTGTLPVSLMSRGQLQALIVSVNCFSGTIPESICANTELTEILMDGMHIAHLCTEHVFPSAVSIPGLIENVAAASDQFGGTIPPCLFGLSHLEYLHLSGNMIKGSIWSSTEEPWNATALVDLDLSHNALTGTVPIEIWTHQVLTDLDLSFNRLHGTIPSSNDANFSSSNASSLYLNVNRFSGPLPAAWTTVGLINVLDGNMFSCKSMHSSDALNEPVNDPTSGYYQCGSHSTNIALLAFGVLLMAVVLVSVVWPFAKGYMETISDPFLSMTYLAQYLTSWWGYDAEQSSVQSTHRLFLLRLLVGTMILVVIGLPVYGVLSVQYATHTHSYVWAVSMAFLEGQTPAYVVLSFLLILGGGLPIYFYHLATLMNASQQRPTSVPIDAPRVDDHRDNGSSAAEAERRGSWNWPLILFVSGLLLLLITNVVIVLIINGAYVYLSGLNLSSAQQSTVSFAISLFKLLWNSIVVTSAFSGFRSLATKLLFQLPTTEATTPPASTASIVLPTAWKDNLIQTVELIAVTLNNVIAPLLAEIFVSAQCFKYALTSPTPITSIVTGGLCMWAFDNSAITNSSSPIICGRSEASVIDEYSDDYYGDIVIFQILESFSNGEGATITYTPGFSYSYQCASSLLATFVVVFVTRYLLSSFLMPSARILGYRMYSSAVFRHGPRSWVTRFWSYWIPLPLRIVDVSSTLEDDGALLSSSTLFAQANIETVLVCNQTQLQQFLRNHQATRWTDALYIRLVSDLAVLLAFGVQFPPLAVVVTISIVVDIVSWQFMLKRLQDMQASLQQHLLHHKMAKSSPDLEAASASSSNPPAQFFHMESVQALHDLLERFVRETTIQLQGFYQRVYTTGVQFGVVCAAILWGFALFDILGNAVGSAKAVWILVLMIMTPLLCMMGIHVKSRTNGFIGAHLSAAVDGKGDDHQSASVTALSPHAPTNRRETAVELTAVTEVQNPLQKHTAPVL